MTTVVQRAALRLPKSLPPAALARAARADALLGSVGAIEPEALLALPDACFDTLTDPLGPWVVAVSLPHQTRLRGGHERAVLNALVARGWKPETLDPRAFPGSMATLNRALAPESRGWRRSGVALGEDVSGQVVRMPPTADARATLGDVPRAAQRPGWPVTARAAAAMGLLLNAHPFTDGNGRTARTLANAILFGPQAGERFIPLYECALRSGGGFEIALRRAELYQDWGALIGWLCGCVELCSGPVGPVPST